MPTFANLGIQVDILLNNSIRLITILDFESVAHVNIDSSPHTVIASGAVRQYNFGVLYSYLVLTLKYSHY